MRFKLLSAAAMSLALMAGEAVAQPQAPAARPPPARRP